MRTLALSLTLAAACSSPGLAEALLDSLVAQAVSSSDRVIDAGRLLAKEDLGELEKIVRQAEAKGLRLRFVTVPDAIEPQAAQARLGDELHLTQEDVLVVAGRKGAFSRAPALAGQAADVTRAFDASRQDFTLGTGHGMAAFGERIAKLADGRRTRESGMSRWSAATLTLLLLAAAVRIVWQLLSAGATRAAVEQSEWHTRVDLAASLLYELGVATEELPGGHVVFLEGWRRYSEIRKTGGREEFAQLDLFLREALGRVRAGQCS